MKFQVPQFIETETKLIGPLTLRQFLFVAGGVSMTAMAYIALNGIYFAIAAILILGFFGALAFVRIDGQPFFNYLAYMLAYTLGAKRYIYRTGGNQNQFTPPHA
ncbi:MAG: PrgI family protein [Candidatus Yanofskybacteria bacterium]|nr:PrgI family protein [Candidatus Yanofskybacteria bacterium]